MAVITIPKNLIRKEEELVLIPRRKYEEFLDLEKIIKIVKPTKSESQVIKQGRKEIKKDKSISWHELKQELAHCSR